MIQNKEKSKGVTVIGLGLMGAKLAHLLVENGFQVTVWNRTIEKARELVEKGAVAASSAAEAISASPVIIVCVYDYRAANEILGAEEAAEKLQGKTIIQLTTGSPQEARESEIRERQLGADYLDGAILATPQQMGKPETMILFSGAKQVFEGSQEILNIFGGKIKYLGEKVGAASAMDLAVLSYFYGSLMGFFHGVRIGEIEGFEPTAFGELVAESSSTLGELIKYESEVIEKGDFTATESSIQISVEAVERILKTAQQAGINTDLPALASKIFQQAKNLGYADEEVAALIKVFRRENNETAISGGKNV